MPEEFLHTPTWEEFEDWKLRGWEIPSSVCCIIRAETSKGKVKEYVYQKQHAAENRVRQLVSEGTLQSRKTPSGKRFIALQTLLAWARSKGADVEDLRFNLAETLSLF